MRLREHGTNKPDRMNGRQGDRAAICLHYDLGGPVHNSFGERADDFTFHRFLNQKYTLRVHAKPKLQLLSRIRSCWVCCKQC